MPGWHPLRRLKNVLPRGLFWRSLIIIVAPMVMLQGFVTYAFFIRHYEVVSRHMAAGVAGDIAFIIDVENAYPAGPTRNQIIDAESRDLSYQIVYSPGERLTPPYRHLRSFFSGAMNNAFASQFGENFPFKSREIGRFVDVDVQLRGGVLRIMVPRDRLFASNADIFVLWMVGSSLVLIAVAILFLRNQIKPIERLALAADAFGKGRAVPDFKPHGATEVRSAAHAFLVMRGRIERYVQQRTEMLAGISHDLKTPLTRLRLQLAMMGEGVDTAPLAKDLTEMEHMLDEYLDFARGEGGEEAQAADLSDLVKDAADAAARARGAQKDRVKAEAPEGIALAVKRNALRRCVTNLIDNALKHGTHVEVALKRHASFVEILVDDDGPGIPEDRREEAFRPFHRLDQGRNLQTGGSGLGLSIARDIARAHGGDLTLGTSRMGGLRAAVRLPV